MFEILKRVINSYKGSRISVVGIISSKDKKVLLTKRSSLIIEGNKWCLPGGSVEKFEKAEDALKREIKEEIGCEIISSKFLFHREEIMKKLNSHNIVLVYKIKVEEKFKPNFEVSEIKYFDKKEIKNLDFAYGQEKILERYFKEFS